MPWTTATHTRPTFIFQQQKRTTKFTMGNFDRSVFNYSSHTHPHTIVNPGGQTKAQPNCEQIKACAFLHDKYLNANKLGIFKFTTFDIVLLMFFFHSAVYRSMTTAANFDLLNFFVRFNKKGYAT